MKVEVDLSVFVKNFRKQLKTSGSETLSHVQLLNQAAKSGQISRFSELPEPEGPL